MAPKKGAKKAKAEPAVETPNDSTKAANSESTKDAPKAEPNVNDGEALSETTKSSNKRKQTSNDDSKQPAKASRRSGRGDTKPQASQQSILKYILSDDAAELCRPDDETEDINARGKSTRTYSSAVLNPFEELMCAVILSRPISHRLGLRSIRTVLNEPYNFTSAKAVQDAGEDKRHQALWDAKTQHKGKTADQLAGLSATVLEKFSSDGDKDGSNLAKMLESDDVDETLALLKKDVKGLGPTGIDIFLRRVQWLWKPAFPYVDSRTWQSLKQLGLPPDSEELQKLLAEHWSSLGTSHLAGEDEEARKRRAFVIVLERAIGADLEGKVDQLIEAANAAA